MKNIAKCWNVRTSNVEDYQQPSLRRNSFEGSETKTYGPERIMKSVSTVDLIGDYDIVQTSMKMLESYKCDDRREKSEVMSSLNAAHNGGTLTGYADGNTVPKVAVDPSLQQHGVQTCSNELRLLAASDSKFMGNLNAAVDCTIGCAIVK